MIKVVRFPIPSQNDIFGGTVCSFINTPCTYLIYWQQFTLASVPILELFCYSLVSTVVDRITESAFAFETNKIINSLRTVDSAKPGLISISNNLEIAPRNKRKKVLLVMAY